MKTLARAVELAQAKRFIEAAEHALEAAEMIANTDVGSKALSDHYGAAAKFFHLGGDATRSVATFDTCFRVFEEMLGKQDSALYLVEQLRVWPELFARAAFVALDAKRPARAVEYAELGRARLTATLICDPARELDPAVERYRSQLTRLALRLANHVFAGESISRDDRRLADALRRERRRLAQSELNAEYLALAAKPASAEVIQRQLASTSVHTCVLYAISLDRETRLVWIDADGFREVDFVGSRAVAEVLDDLSNALASGRNLADEVAQAALEAALQRALARAQAVWKPVFERLLEKRAPDRLIWIPHGPLVLLPIAALRSNGLRLVDHVAVQVAPSLGVGSALFRTASVETSRAVSIKGPDPQDLTVGGECVITPLDGSPGVHACIADTAELKARIRDRNTVLFSWTKPLARRGS